MKTSIQRNGELTIFINDKRVRSLGGNHFGITRDQVKGIDLKEAHEDAVFMVGDRVDKSGVCPGSILYTIQKMADDQAEVCYTLIRHKPCWPKSISLFRYFEVAREIVSKLADSHGITDIGDCDNEGDSMSLSFKSLITGTKFEMIINAADDCVANIMSMLDNLEGDFDKFISDEISNIKTS
jgi:hypothetical protein